MDRPGNFQLHLKQQEAAAEIRTTSAWRGVCVQFSRLRLPVEYEYHCEGRSHYIAHHDLMLLDGEVEVMGEKPIAGRDLRDTLTYVPAGLTIDGWCKPVNRMNAFTIVNFNPLAMEEELQIAFKGSDPHPQIHFRDDQLCATLRKLGKVMAQDEKPAAIYAEALGLTAALEMVRMSQTEPSAIKQSGRLSQVQAKRVTDFIAENLMRDIGLDDLASVCGLSRFHFSRAFKTTFGEPPHKYLTACRIQRARQMLAGSELSIPAIARACGFNGTSQFGRTFRDVTGQTPLEFRRQA